MGLLVQSIKFFNETRNGQDFSLNPSDYTDTLKGNVGEKVKVEAIFDYNLITRFEPISTVKVEVATGGSGDRVILKGADWFDLGYRNGDIIELRRFDIGPPTGGLIVEATIDQLSGNIARVTVGATFSTGEYDDFNIVLVSEFKTFTFDFSTPLDVNGVRTAYSNFNLPQIYSNVDTTAVGDGGPRSTAFVDFNPRNPSNWNTGKFRMRYDSDPEPNTQRFVFEHEFIITPYHLEGNTYIPLTTPSQFNQGTLAYKFLLNQEEIIFGGQPRLFYDYDQVGSVGWFNENFDGNANTYNLESISYYDVNEAVAIPKINFDSITRVTMVVTGALFTTSDPLMVYHSKAPIEADYQDVNDTFDWNFVYDSHRNLIGDPSTSGDIIKNLSINLDSPTQITIQYDLEYTLLEEVNNDDNYLLWIATEDSNLTPGNSNRVSLFADYNTYTKSLDEADLFIIDNYNIYTHLESLGVDTPFTDMEGYIEDGVLIEMDFRMKNDFLLDSEFGNDNKETDNFEFYLSAYNTVDKSFFKLTRSARFTFGPEKASDGLWKYSDDWQNYWKFYNFFLADDDQFNRAHTDSPTFVTDISYQSNDGTYGSYKALIGIKVDWQEIIKLDENASGRRVGSDQINDYFEDILGLDSDYSFGDVLKFALFTDSNEIHNGYNKQLSKYKAGNWIIRPVVQCYRDNIFSSEETRFFYFMPEWNIYDYDTNSDYVGTTETFDADDVDLGGALIQGEDNKVVVTFDDGNVKTDVANIEGIIRIEVRNQTGYAIHELSTFRDTYPGNILKGYGAGGDKTEKSIIGDKYTLTCLVDGSLLTAEEYKITGRLYDRQVAYDPVADNDLTAWYDASGLVTNTNNAFGIVSALNEVSVWKNLKADSTYDLFNPTVANQPLFDPINLKVDTAFSPKRFLYWLDKNLGSEYTWFAVYEAVAGGGVQSWLSYNEGLSGLPSEDYVWLTDEFSPFARMYSRQPPTVSSLNISEPAGRGAGKVVVQGSFNYGNDWYLKVNNNRYDAPDDIQNTPNVGATNQFCVGGTLSRAGGPTPTIGDIRDGKFHEILIFANQDVSGKESLVHDYLKNKWGI